MDPNLEKSQSDQPQERQSGAGLRGPLGNIVSRRIARQAVLGVFRTLLINPWALPLIAALVLVLSLTIAIVAGIGAPSSDSSGNQTSNAAATEVITPASAPTESPTPTPPAGP